jgi:small subunit ribosomal protein S11
MSEEAIKQDGGAGAAGAAPAVLSEAAAVLASGDADAKAAADAKALADAKARKVRAKSIPAGIAFVRASFNNTTVSITDARGGVIAWSSAGRAGFKGSRKCTAFAATMVAQDAARQASTQGMHEVEIRIQGAGAGRESAVRAIQSAGMQVSLIKDCTPIPHNGCRPRKRRRV